MYADVEKKRKKKLREQIKAARAKKSCESSVLKMYSKCTVFFKKQSRGGGGNGPNKREEKIRGEFEVVEMERE